MLLLDGEMVKDLGQSNYKHLGVLEVTDIKGAEMKKKVTKEYVRRLNLLLKSTLNGGNHGLCAGVLEKSWGESGGA